MAKSVFRCKGPEALPLADETLRKALVFICKMWIVTVIITPVHLRHWWAYGKQSIQTGPLECLQTQWKMEWKARKEMQRKKQQKLNGSSVGFRRSAHKRLYIPIYLCENMKAMALMAPTLMEAKPFQSQCPKGSHCFPWHEMTGGAGQEESSLMAFFFFPKQAGK